MVPKNNQHFSSNLLMQIKEPIGGFDHSVAPFLFRIRIPTIARHSGTVKVRSVFPLKRMFPFANK